MAINTNKPVSFDETDIEAFEGKPENRSRGKVQFMEFPSDVDEDKPSRFWVAKPNRRQLSIIADVGDKSDKANDLIINTAVLAGDTEQLDLDDELYFGLLHEVQGLFKAKKKI